MPQRLRALDGLRGLLALYILVGHTLPFLRMPPALAAIGALAVHGRAAVDLFFILSGFVILHALDQQAGLTGPQGAARFLALRAGRLMPVYLLALGLACAGLALGDPFRVMPWLPPESAAHVVLEAGWPPQPGLHVAAHLLLLQSLLPPAVLPDAEYALLGPAWSLGTEWQFYGLTAFCIAFIPSLLARGAGRLMTVLLLLGLLGLGLAALPEPWRFGRAILPRAAWYFALGMASHARLTGRIGPGRFILVLAVAVAMSATTREAGIG